MAFDLTKKRLEEVDYFPFYSLSCQPRNERDKEGENANLGEEER